MTPNSLGDALRSLLPGGGGPRDPDDLPDPAYTIVFPPTMLWVNFQRPHQILTHLARRHEVRCLFNDWTVREERFEGGRLIVTRRAFRARYHRRPLVYYYSIPEKLGYLRRHRLRPDLLVFELMDLPEREFEAWKGELPKTLARADVIRTTHPAITAYLRRGYGDILGSKPIVTSRNGVDLALFDPGRTYERPAELAGIDEPILGFYGNLDWWIDWSLVGRLAELEGVRVVIIGDTEGRRPKVPPELLRSSIVWIGRKPIAELPAYLSCFDAALFPFVVNEMTDAVDPLKVWEYLAFGKPVLATPTAFVRERPELFHVVDEGDLAGCVARAIASGRDPEAAAARRDAAAERDWGTIADELHDDIVRALEAPGVAAGKPGS